MLESAKQYNDYTQPRHYGVSRRFTRPGWTPYTLSYSSLNHTVSQWYGCEKQMAVECPNVETARRIWRDAQRIILKTGYTYSLWFYLFPYCKLHAEQDSNFILVKIDDILRFRLTSISDSEKDS